MYIVNIRRHVYFAFMQKIRAAIPFFSEVPDFSVDGCFLRVFR